jgi:hypothetical protein
MLARGRALRMRDLVTVTPVGTTMPFGQKVDFGLRQFCMG